MAYEFQKLADVEAVEEFPEEGASVLIEHEGGIKKCPADGIGGGGSIPVLLMSAEASGELNFEFEDGRTLDEFVADFDNGVYYPTIILKTGESLYQPGLKVTYALTFYQCLDYTEGYDGSTPSGGRTMIYVLGGSSELLITNIDSESGELMDHYSWVMG